MTVGTMLVGLVPLLWSRGSGSDVMRRIAAPMVGGLITSAFLTLEIIPVIYTYWRNEQLTWSKLARHAPSRLPVLRTMQRLAVIAAGVLLAALLVPLYVRGATPLGDVARVANIVMLVSSALAIGAVLGYFAFRPWAVHGLGGIEHALEASDDEDEDQNDDLTAARPDTGDSAS